MKNIRILILSVVFIISGFALRISKSLAEETRVIGMCIMLMGLIIFSLFLYNTLKK